MTTKELIEKLQQIDPDGNLDWHAYLDEVFDTNHLYHSEEIAISWSDGDE